MTSIDANLLLYAANSDSPRHEEARQFLAGLTSRRDVALSEFILVELYVLLRNPIVLKAPLSGPDAVEVIQRYRHHPRWRLLGFPSASRELHSAMWRRAAQPNLGRRRIFDTRTALCLIRNGVTDFATANTSDFQDLGFARVWNPLDD